MQLISKFDAILIGAREAGEGKNGKYYNVSLEQDDASCEVSCTKELYDTVKSGLIPKYAKATFFAGYQSEFKSYRVLEVVPFCEEKKK